MTVILHLKSLLTFSVLKTLTYTKCSQCPDKTIRMLKNAAVNTSGRALQDCLFWWKQICCQSTFAHYQHFCDLHFLIMLIGNIILVGIMFAVAKELYINIISRIPGCTYKIYFFYISRWKYIVMINLAY